MKLENDDPISNFAFNFNLRRYTKSIANSRLEGYTGAPLELPDFSKVVGRTLDNFGRDKQTLPSTSSGAL